MKAFGVTLDQSASRPQRIQTMKSILNADDNECYKYLEQKMGAQQDYSFA